MKNKLYKNYKLVITVLVILIVFFIACFFYFKNYKVYKISIDAGNGESIIVTTVKGGKKLSRPENPVREGYQFIEWQLNGETYNFDAPINENITLTAVWRSISDSEEYFTISFDTNGGNNIPSQSIKNGELITKPEVPTKKSTEKIKYTFETWTLNGIEFDFSTPVTSNITLVAKWKEEELTQKYVVTFDSNGGSSVDAQTVRKDAKAIRPSNPTKDGYTFVEWQLNGKAYNFDTAVTSNITLVAKWKENTSSSDNKNYTVTFNSNGGSAVSSQTIKSGEKATKPTNPTRSGYTFVEWQLNNLAYNFNTPVTSNITLIAKWKENTVQNYTVTFNSNGGSAVSSQTIKSGEKATKPTNPTRSGYTFVEWQLNGSTYNFNTPVTSNITLVAKWTQKTYTIKLVPTDSSAFCIDYYLRVYDENDTQITVYKIYLTDGTTEQTGQKVNKYDVEEEYLVQIQQGGEKFLARVVAG